MIETIINNKREIIQLDLIENSACTVGKLGVTKIEPYNEPGEMGYVTWFAIWKGDKIWSKINGRYVITVIYAV